MADHCFWILTDGTIIVPASRHILAVAADPFLFGETEESIKATFFKHGQAVLSNHEGEAREEVLARVIRRNHIRIRKYQQRRSQHWSIQLHELTAERKRALSAWARMIFPNTTDKFAEVMIHELCSGRKSTMPLQRLADENQCEAWPIIVRQVQRF